MNRFRRRFRLAPAERTYLGTRGFATVLRHARELIAQRLAPAEPAKGRPLADDEQAHVVAAIERWLRAQDRQP